MKNIVDTILKIIAGVKLNSNNKNETHSQTTLINAPNNQGKFIIRLPSNRKLINNSDTNKEILAKKIREKT